MTSFWCITNDPHTICPSATIATVGDDVVLVVSHQLLSTEASLIFRMEKAGVGKFLPPNMQA
jgi:hypothetical protein